MVDLKKLVDRKLKAPRAFFDWCQSQIPIYQWENKERKIISSDRKGVVIKKRLSKNSRLSFHGGFFPFAIILSSSKRIEIQSWAYWQEIENGVEKIEYRLTNMEVLMNDKHYKLHQYGDNYVSEGLVSNYSMMGGAYQNTSFYPNNYVAKLQKSSELRYVSIPKNLNFQNLPRLYKFRREIEFCQKIEAKGVERDILYYSADMRVVNMKWLKKNKSILKHSVSSFSYFKLKEEIEKRNGRLVEGIVGRLCYRDIKYIPKEIGIVAFQNWYLKNKLFPFSDYQDYLLMLEEMGIPITGRNRILPSNFKKAHDDLVKVYNEWKLIQKEEEEKKKNKEYRKRLNDLLKLETCIDSFSFLIPRDLKEIIKEGAELHHCVGSYIDAHRAGRTTIIFVRKSDNLGKPFYTLEVKSGSLIQLRGNYNSAPPKQVKAAAEKFVEWAKDRMIA